jgi:hypothetical protein
VFKTKKGKKLDLSPYLKELVISEVLTHKKKTLNSVALVYKRTIPTERPPLVGEISANFCG